MKRRAVTAGQPVGARAGRWSAVVLCASAATGLSVSTASNAVAAACDALVVTHRSESADGSVVVLPPTALIGQALTTGDVSLEQGGQSVGVTSVRPVGAAEINLVIVLDTAAAAPDAVVGDARALARSLLRGLSPETQVAVVSGAGDPAVLTPFGTDRSEVLEEIRQAARGGRRAEGRAVALARNLLENAGSSVGHILLLSTGRKAGDPGVVRRSLEDAEEQPGLFLTATTVADQLDPAWGEQCPPTVADDNLAAAGSLLAARVSSLYEVVAPATDAATPLTVRIGKGPVDVEAQLPAVEAHGPSGTAPPASAGREPTESSGSPIAALAWVVGGVAVFAAILVAVLLRTSRQHPDHAASRGNRRRRRTGFGPFRPSVPAGRALAPPAPAPQVPPEPVVTEPVEPELLEPGLVEPEPVVPEPVEPEPVVPEPVDPEPVEPEPVEPEPVVPEPVEPEPVVPEPEAREPGPAQTDEPAAHVPGSSASSRTMRRRRQRERASLRLESGTRDATHAAGPDGGADEPAAVDAAETEPMPLAPAQAGSPAPERPGRRRRPPSLQPAESAEPESASPEALMPDATSGADGTRDGRARAAPHGTSPT